MELSPGRQKLLFVGIVVALAAVGYFLVVPSLHKAPVAGPAALSTPTAVPPAAGQPTVAPAVTEVPAGTVNIYDWLPFTQQDLADAAAVAVRFAIDYDTFSYTDSPASYVGRMNGLITGQLAATLQNAYSTPGVAGLRTAQKQVSTATAAIVSLRAFGPSSLTFIVNIGQRLVSLRGTSNSSTQYAVTLTGSGGSWRVNDIEFRLAGNT